MQIRQSTLRDSIAMIEFKYKEWYMIDKGARWGKHKSTMVAKNGGAGGIWFLGFIGALAYYLHVHSGTFWLVILATLKAIVWPAFLVYHLLLFLRV